MEAAVGNVHRMFPPPHATPMTQVVRSMQGAGVLVVPISSSTKDSESCRAELFLAQSLGVPILPIKAEEP